MNAHKHGEPLYELGLLDYQTDQMPADPLIEEIEEGDSDHVEDTSKEVESDDIYVGRVFRDENETV